MKAWKVEDPDGRGCVVHADTRGQARHLGASDLDYQAEYIGYSATRYPLFDGQKVTPLALIADGWWWECGCCGAKLDEERINDEDLAPVESRSDLFCGQDCLDDLRNAQAKARKQIAAWDKQLAMATKAVKW